MHMMNPTPLHARPSSLQGWSFSAFVAFFAVFNALPTLIELLVLVFVTRFAFLKY